jgi:Cu2+-exporting ATPase
MSANPLRSTESGDLNKTSGTESDSNTDPLPASPQVVQQSASDASNTLVPLKPRKEASELPDGELLHLDFVVRHQITDRLRFYCPQMRSDADISELVRRKVNRFKGVSSVRINVWCGGLIVEFDQTVVPASDLIKKVEGLRIKLSETGQESTEVFRPVNGKWMMRASHVVDLIERYMPPILQVSLGGGGLICSFLGLPPLAARILLGISILPISGRAARTYIDERKIGVDGLDGLAAMIMMTSGRLTEACFMTGLIGLGELIREQTARQCRKIVDDLLGLSGRSAWLVKGRKRVCVPIDEVKVGDVVVIYPGELVPIDGLVTAGEASIDQSKLTGEALPVEVRTGHHVYAATILLEGKVYVTCESTGINTRAGLALEAVKEAPLHETKIQNYAALMADKLVVPIMIGATTCFALTHSVVRLMSMLIFDFSTGIRIAAPTAVLSSMHRAGRKGILVKSGAALERLSVVDAIVFDKTGTLTLGEPRVTRVVPFGSFEENKLVALAAAVEQRFHHPASRAIIKCAAQRLLTVPERSDSDHLSGMGVKAKVEDFIVACGSRKLMESEEIDLSFALSIESEINGRSESLAYVAIDGKLAGLIAYSDQIRPEAADAIRELKRLGVKKLVMATGDSEEVARLIAGASGITDILAKAFPEKKADLVKQLKSEGYTVAVIGDGINDSPALAHADVALSLHGGTEAAREGADIVLTDADLRRLPEAIKIARSAMGLVSQNLSLAMVPNSAGLFLAAVGLVGPAGATLLNNGSAIVAALNSLRPLYIDSWSKSETISPAEKAAIEKNALKIAV